MFANQTNLQNCFVFSHTGLISPTDHKKQKRGDSVERPRAKEARKEKKVLEKKMALNRKRKLDSRYTVKTSSRNAYSLAALGKRTCLSSFSPYTL